MTAAYTEMCRRAGSSIASLGLHRAYASDMAASIAAPFALCKRTAQWVGVKLSRQQIVLGKEYIALGSQTHTQGVRPKAEFGLGGF